MKTLKELEKMDREITLETETPRRPTVAVNIFMGFLSLLGIVLFCLAVYGIVRVGVYFISLI